MISFFNSNKFQDFIASYTGEKATSIKSAAYILLFLSLGTLFTDFNGSPDQFSSWTFASLTSYLVSLAYFASMGSLINKWQPELQIWRTISISALFFTTEMWRAIYVANFELILDINSTIDWDYRVVAGGLTGILFFGIFSIFQNDSANYKNKLLELNDKELKLRNSSKVSSQDLENIRNKALLTIRNEISESVQVVLNESKKDSSDFQALSDELMRISEEVVRPISHSIFEADLEKSETQSSKQLKLFSTQLPELASLNPFFPKAYTFFAAIQIVGLALFGVENKLFGIYSLLTYSAWIYLVLTFGEKILRPLLPKMNLYLRFILISFTYITLALCPFVFDFVAETFRIPQNINFVIWLSLIALIMIWPITFYVAIRNARIAIIDEITQANEKLSWSTARLGAQLWAEKQKFAHLIHKNIQGSLIAAAMRLKSDLNSGVQLAEAKDKVKQLLESDENLNFSNSAVQTVEEHINYLNDIWDGVFTIEIDLNLKIKSKLSLDSVAQNSLNDLLTEFATNSVKHGKSSHGKITFKLLTNNVLEVTMQNNGLNFPNEMKQGLGSKMALEQCISISQKNLVPQGVEFTFTLPIK